MIVVSDTSPLNYLILIGQQNVLTALFDRVVAPPAVLAEMQQRGAPEIVARRAASLTDLIAESQTRPQSSQREGNP